MAAPRLTVLLASTREGRKNGAVARWFLEHAQAHGKFDLAPVDLKELALPMLEEPNHPRLQCYVQEKTKAWSRTVAASDAFVFVTPEYNFGMPPALLNALDHLFAEWHYKPVGFVSYGGISGGIRSTQMAKQMVSSLKMVPLLEAVTLPFFESHLREDGTFEPGETPLPSLRAMLDELLRWSDALRVLRA